MNERIKLYDPEQAKSVTLSGQKIVRELIEKLAEQGCDDIVKELKNENGYCKLCISSYRDE